MKPHVPRQMLNARDKELLDELAHKRRLENERRAECAALAVRRRATRAAERVRAVDIGLVFRVAREAGLPAHEVREALAEGRDADELAHWRGGGWFGERRSG